MCAPGTNAAASTTTADAEQRYCELLEEARRGIADQANLLLQQAARQLAQGFCLLSVVPLASAPAPAITATGRVASAATPPVSSPENISNNDKDDFEADSNNNNADSKERGNDGGIDDNEE